MGILLSNWTVEDKQKRGDAEYASHSLSCAHSNGHSVLTVLLCTCRHICPVDPHEEKQKVRPLSLQA